MKKCDVCHKTIDDVFYDGKTVYGLWANMCPACYDTIGIGLGLGLGQMYRKDTDGKYIKVAG